MMRLSLVLAAAMLALGAPRASADAMPERLIDQLAQIDCNGPGLYENLPFPDFWAVVPDLDAGFRAEQRKGDCIPDAMRALVRLGPRALPALIRHIRDPRPTRLKIGTTLDPKAMMTGGQLFSTEYESRVFAYDPDSWLAPFLDKCSGDDMCFAGRDFRTPYTIRIGDVCFTLIGQIVNRALVAARYQPTGFVMVNSPVETPSLAERVARDWAGTGADALKASLLADLHAKPHGPPPQGPKSEGDAQDEAAMLRSYVYPGALRRLRFYFPDAYAALSGEDLATKQAFEQDEAETARAYAKNAH